MDYEDTGSTVGDLSSTFVVPRTACCKANGKCGSFLRQAHAYSKFRIRLFARYGNLQRRLHCFRPLQVDLKGLWSDLG